MRYLLLIIGILASLATVSAYTQDASTAGEPSPRVSAALSARVQATIAQDNARVIAIFKDIHQHPELGFMELRTAAIVAQELEALGFEVKTGIGKTGVVGILRNGNGPTVLYRADMDANAVKETTGLAYASDVRVVREDGQDVPVAHMCGHDAHVSWMLGMAKAMVSHKSDWSGTLILVGQPAEEPIEGAQAMVDDGLYTSHGVPVPDFMLSMHTAPLPVGQVVGAGGVRFAGTDQIDVIFHGIGGHGSSPHLAKDPVLMAALAVVQYQSIVSRIIDPQDTAVLTVGSIQAGTDNNVIPASALLKINLRWFKPEVREQMIDGIRDINESIARAYGMPDDLMPTMTIKGGSTPLINDDALIERINVPLKQMMGEEQVITQFPMVTGSEDAHLLRGEHQEISLAYMVVGVADPEVFARALEAGKQVPYYNHNGNFIVDPAAIPLGTRVATIAALELLANADQ